MRNAMLTVLGRLVMNLLTGDNLDENQKNLREEFLDTLCEHMHDINGFVRAKVQEETKQDVFPLFVAMRQRPQIMKLLPGQC